MIGASVPPARITSAWPRRIDSAASPTAVEPVAQAETGAKFWPRRPSWIAIWPLAVSTSTDGMKNGETRSGPRSAKTICCSAIVAIPPIADPTRIPARARSTSSSPASSHASCAAATASRTFRSMRRASLAGIKSPISKPVTSAAIRTGYSDASKASIQPTPLRPETAASHVDGASSPMGVTAPSPVMTTRRIGSGDYSAVRCGRAAPPPHPNERAGRAAGRPRPRDPVPADGGRARPRAARGRRVAVRAEVGRLPRPARERLRRAAPLVAERAPPPSLLPGARAARRPPAPAIVPRRRDRDRP